MQAVPHSLLFFQQWAENGKRLRICSCPSSCTTAFLQAPAALVHGLPPARETARRARLQSLPQPRAGKAATPAAAIHTPALSLSLGVWMESSTCDTHSNGNSSSHVSVKQTWHCLQGAAARCAGDCPTQSLDDICLPLYADILQGICLAVPTRQESHSCCNDLPRSPQTCAQKAGTTLHPSSQPAAPQGTCNQRRAPLLPGWPSWQRSLSGGLHSPSQLQPERQHQRLAAPAQARRSHSTFALPGHLPGATVPELLPSSNGVLPGELLATL